MGWEHATPLSSSQSTETRLLPCADDAMRAVFHFLSISFLPDSVSSNDKVFIAKFHPLAVGYAEVDADDRHPSLNRTLG